MEFAVPGARVLEVRGPDVRAWNQSAGRVQVWLRAAARDGAFEWCATADRGAGDAPAFDLVPPQVFGAIAGRGEVRVRPADGFAVRTESARGWLPLPAPPGEVWAAAEAPGPPLRVRLDAR